MHTIDANTEERRASHVRRHGNRYYPVDQSYDKKVYENDFANYMKIVGALLLFWMFNAFHWLGILSLGIVNADALAWYSIGCFIFTVIFLASILCSGKYANAIKRKHEYLMEKIAEKQAEEKEQRAKIEQQAAHEEKIAAQQEKIAQLKREAAAEKATAAPAPATTQGQVQKQPGFIQTVVTGIQDARLLQPDSRA